MHKLLATGNIGQNAVIRSGQQSEFITFTVAVNKKYKDSNGVDVEKTTWYNCIYQPKSMAVAQYLITGQKVLIEGEPNTKLYQDSKGEWKIDNSVTVRSIELLSSGTSTQQAAPEQTEPQQATAPTKRNQSGQFVKQQPAMESELDNNDLPF